MYCKIDKEFFRAVKKAKRQVAERLEVDAVAFEISFEGENWAISFSDVDNDKTYAELTLPYVGNLLNIITKFASNPNVVWNKADEEIECDDLQDGRFLCGYCEDYGCEECGHYEDY